MLHRVLNEFGFPLAFSFSFLFLFITMCVCVCVGVCVCLHARVCVYVWICVFACPCKYACWEFSSCHSSAWLTYIDVVNVKLRFYSVIVSSGFTFVLLHALLIGSLSLPVFLLNIHSYEWTGFGLNSGFLLTSFLTSGLLVKQPTSFCCLVLVVVVALVALITLFACLKQRLTLVSDLTLETLN